MITDKIEMVRMLSQDEGWYDWEIALHMNVHRVTVTRWREQHGIPRPNLRNREDKKQVCKRCGAEDYIRRKHRIKRYCKSCKQETQEALKQKKREYMKSYDKNKKHSEGMLQNP